MSFILTTNSIIIIIHVFINILTLILKILKRRILKIEQIRLRCLMPKYRVTKTFWIFSQRQCLNYPASNESVVVVSACVPERGRAFFRRKVWISSSPSDECAFGRKRGRAKERTVRDIPTERTMATRVRFLF